MMDSPKDKAKAKAGLAALRSSNVEIRTPTSPQVHAKIMVVDAEKLFLGSQNVEDAPAEERRELGIIFTDPFVREQVSTVFERDWGYAPVAR